jgi:hypothetical protein
MSSLYVLNNFFRFHFTDFVIADLLWGPFRRHGNVTGGERRAVFVHIVWVLGVGVKNVGLIEQDVRMGVGRR